LNVVAQTGVDRQARTNAPLILREDAEVRIGLKLRRLAECLLKYAVPAIAEVGQRRDLIRPAA
jgi:hypothetical protein